MAKPFPPLSSLAKAARTALPGLSVASRYHIRADRSDRTLDRSSMRRASSQQSVRDRSPADLRVTVYRTGGALPDVYIHDLSVTGFAMESSEVFHPGQTIWIGLTGGGASAARVVRQTADGWACQFLQPISEQECQAARVARPVVTTPWAGLGAAGTTEPEMARWPLLARVAFIVGSSLALWTAIFWIFQR